MSSVNIVVLPLPVGALTPMRVIPAAMAERHSDTASSWYGRSLILLGIGGDSVEFDCDADIVSGTSSIAGVSSA